MGGPPQEKCLSARVPHGPNRVDRSEHVFIVARFKTPATNRWQEENFGCCMKEERFPRQKFKIVIDLKTLFSSRESMAEERFISTCDLSSSYFYSVSSPDSMASLEDITDSGHSSWDFSPPAMLDGNGGPLFHMKALEASLLSRKRDLSKYFTGKSQSFTPLADVKCVEDLAKPEKKLKSSHSWESTIKSSYNNQTIQSSILSEGSAESREMPRKALFLGRKMSKKSSRLVPCRLLLSPPKQIM